MNPTTTRAIATYIALSKNGVVHDEMLNVAIHLIITIAVMDSGDYCDMLKDVIKIIEGAAVEPPPVEAVEALKKYISVKTNGGVCVEVSRAFVKDGAVDMELFEKTMGEPKGQA